MGTAPVGRHLFYRGAEADLYVSRFRAWDAIIKDRVRKSYRHPDLDSQIRRERTAKEATVLHQARSAGVRTPVVLDLDLQANSITMTKIAGTVARDDLDKFDGKKASRFFFELGRQIGLLHQAGLVHGDLTTSNIIVSKEGIPFVLDFGMSSHSSEFEDRGVDMHLLRKSVGSSHVIDPRDSAKAVRRGYRVTAGGAAAKRTFEKASEISRRGRYFAIR